MPGTTQRALTPNTAAGARDPPNKWFKGHELLAAQRQTRVAQDPPRDASRWMAEREPAHLSEIGQETMAGDDDA